MQVLTFYGNLKVRVLGGVVNVESYAMLPCDGVMTLCIPQSRQDPAVRMAAMDPGLAVRTVGMVWVVFVCYSVHVLISVLDPGRVLFLGLFV